MENLTKTAAPPSRRARAGFKHFFSPPPLKGPDFRVRAIGVHELMKPCMVRRPQGTSDYLLMLFHDEVRVSTTDDPGEPHPPETFMIWPPGRMQHYGNSKRAFSHSWIHCDGTSVGSWLAGTGLPVGRPFTLSQPLSFTSALLAVHTELISHVEPDDVIAAHHLEIGLREIARQRRASDHAVGLPSGLLLARRQIATESRQRITLPLLAATAGMSVSSFCQNFKKAFGTSPMQCLINHRLDHAAYLLEDFALSVAEVAARVGYDDAFHFSKAFKKRFGRSPRAMRRARIEGVKNSDAPASRRQRTSS